MKKITFWREKHARDTIQRDREEYQRYDTL